MREKREVREGVINLQEEEGVVIANYSYKSDRIKYGIGS